MPNETVSSPVTGRVSRIVVAYANTNYRGVEIETPDGLKVKVLYVDPSVSVGDIVSAGEPIGDAQDISERYVGITNHVHVEMQQFGELIDPTPLMGLK